MVLVPQKRTATKPFTKQIQHIWYLTLTNILFGKTQIRILCWLLDPKIKWKNPHSCSFILMKFDCLQQCWCYLFSNQIRKRCWTGDSSFITMFKFEQKIFFSRNVFDLPFQLLHFQFERIEYRDEKKIYNNEYQWHYSIHDLEL